MAIIPDPRTQTLVILSSSTHVAGSDPSAPVEHGILYARFTFDGHIIAYNEFQTPGYTILQITGIQPINEHGGFGLNIAARHPDRRVDGELYLQFDQRTFTFTYCNCPMFSLTIVGPGMMDERIAWWKDTFYQALPEPLNVLDADELCYSPLLAQLGTRFVRLRKCPGAHANSASATNLVFDQYSRGMFTICKESIKMRQTNCASC